VLLQQSLPNMSMYLKSLTYTFQFIQAETPSLLLASFSNYVET